MIPYKYFCDKHQPITITFSNFGTTNKGSKSFEVFDGEENGMTLKAHERQVQLTHIEEGFVGKIAKSLEMM